MNNFIIALIILACVMFIGSFIDEKDDQSEYKIEGTDVMYRNDRQKEGNY